jgi:hypothetical protein
VSAQPGIEPTPLARPPGVRAPNRVGRSPRQPAGQAGTPGVQFSIDSKFVVSDVDEEVARKQYADRLAHDATLVEAMRREGFTGDAFDDFADALLAAAIVKVQARIVSGHMFIASRDMGRPVPAEEQGLAQLRRCQPDLESLALHVVERAWARFLPEALISQGWQPHLGATLTTYFRGACDQVFADCYRSWFARFLRRNHEAPCDPTDLSLLFDRSSTESTRLDEFVEDENAAALLSHLSVSHRQTVILVALGFTRREVAAILDVEEGTVNTRLFRAAAKLKPIYNRERRPLE